MKKALELFPDQPLVLNYLGYSWVDQGVHLDEGMDMIRRAVEQRPDDGYIVDSLGWAYFRTGNYDEAVKNLERAVELKPEDPTINDHLGDAYWRVGRTLEAHFQWSQAQGPQSGQRRPAQDRGEAQKRAARRHVFCGGCRQGEEGRQRRVTGVFVRSARRERAGQSQSDAAGARPPRRRLSRDRKPGRVRRLRRPAWLFAGRRACARRCAGRRAAQAGAGADNLVLKAARALAARIPDLGLGAFHLDKRLPVAAGLGGGSADAGAALRLLARANGLARDDPRLYEAARATGADVPVCLDPRPRLMRGIGEKLSAPLRAAAAAGGAGQSRRRAGDQGGVCRMDAGGGACVAHSTSCAAAKLTSREQLLQLLMTQANDLEGAAIALAPVIADVLAALRALPGCRLARMSGSGATCFALFSSAAAARAAAKSQAANIRIGG